MNETTEFASTTEKLLTETARIKWRELQRFFAQGAVLNVDASLDLVHIASLFADDNAKELEPLLGKLLIHQPSNEQARTWYNDDAELWSVVVSPYVLVQDKEQNKSEKE